MNTPSDKRPPLTEDQQKEIRDLLKSSKTNDKTFVELSAENSTYTVDDFAYWNQKFEIIPVQKKIRRTEKEWAQILEYAGKHGVANASRKFDISHVTISTKNRESGYKYFKPRERRENFDAIFIQTVLCEVHELMIKEKIKKREKAIKIIAEKYNIHKNYIYAWENSEPTEIKIPTEEIQSIESEALNFKSVSALSRNYGRSIQVINNIFDAKGLYYNKLGLQTVSDNNIAQQVIQDKQTAISQR